MVIDDCPYSWMHNSYYRCDACGVVQHGRCPRCLWEKSHEGHCPNCFNYYCIRFDPPGSKLKKFSEPHRNDWGSPNYIQEEACDIGPDRITRLLPSADWIGETLDYYSPRQISMMIKVYAGQYTSKIDYTEKKIRAKRDCNRDRPDEEIRIRKYPVGQVCKAIDLWRSGARIQCVSAVSGIPEYVIRNSSSQGIY